MAFPDTGVATSPLPPQLGLAWTNDIFTVTPTWTLEPDIFVISALATVHLPVQERGYETTVFAAGAFNKLFLLTPQDPSSGTTPKSAAQCYIMRVSLPVDPYFKTASEVATLLYLSRHTSIVVPRVIAYDTSPDPALGFEWILMTRLPGVPLKELWESPVFSWEDRVRTTQVIAEYVHQMQHLKFDCMGSLYMSKERHAPLHWHRVAGSVVDSADDVSHFRPLDGDSDFSIGPVVAMSLFYGNRIKMQSDRGPFKTSAAWIRSLLELQIASTTDTKTSATEAEYDADDIGELDEIIAAARELLALVPRFFGDTDKEQFVLYHDDLSLNNILIDPLTHQVTGLVDWECVSLQPMWKAERPPQFLYGPDINTDCFGPIPDVAPLPPAAGAEEEDEMHAELRENLEKMLLRRVYYASIGAELQPLNKLKRVFDNKITQADVMPGKVVKWAKDVKGGEDPAPAPYEDMGMYFWAED